MSLVLSILFFVSCSNNATDPNGEQTEVIPKKTYKFDVKTKFSDKIQSAGAKSGVSAFLKKSGWADIGETNENYSVWIMNLVRTRKSDRSVTVDFTLELHTPAMFFDGELIPGCRKHFTVNYKLDADFDIVSKPITPESVINGLSSVVDVANNSPLSKIPSIYLYVGTASAVTKLLPIILNFIDSGTTKEHQLEACYVGGFCYDRIKEWIKAIEK